jgi:hypothetical protein
MAHGAQHHVQKEVQQTDNPVHQRCKTAKQQAMQITAFFCISHPAWQRKHC